MVVICFVFVGIVYDLGLDFVVVNVFGLFVNLFQIMVLFVVYLGYGDDVFYCFFFGCYKFQNFSVFDVEIGSVGKMDFVFIVDVNDVDIFVGCFCVVLWIFGNGYFDFGWGLGVLYEFFDFYVEVSGVLSVELVLVCVDIGFYCFEVFGISMFGYKFGFVKICLNSWQVFFFDFQYIDVLIIGDFYGWNVKFVDDISNCLQFC